MSKTMLHLAAGTLAVLFAGVSAVSAQTSVIISGSIGVNQLPTLVAEEKGYFEEEGLQVELKPVARGGIAIEALAGESVQFAEAAHVPLMAAISQGIPLVAVGVVNRGFLGKVVASNDNTDIDSLEDLKGKRIGLQVGTGMHTILRMIFRDQGIDEAELNVSNLRNTDMPAAMVTGDAFDVVIGWEPHMQRIVQEGAGTEVISAQEIQDMAGITYPFLLATTETFLEENPEAVQGVLNAYAKAHQFIRENNEEAVDIYTAYLQETGAELEREIAEYIVFEVERFGGVGFSEGDLQDIRQTREFLIEIGEIEASIPPVEEFVKTEMAEQAEAALQQ